MEQDRIEDKY